MYTRFREMGELMMARLSPFIDPVVNKLSSGYQFATKKLEDYIFPEQEVITPLSKAIAKRSKCSTETITKMLDNKQGARNLLHQEERQELNERLPANNLEIDEKAYWELFTREKAKLLEEIRVYCPEVAAPSPKR